jgi:hypothetical protein
MANPQQPELRRSERGAATDTSTKERLTAPSVPGIDGPGGRVPEANAPGHHPAEEQDKPSGRDFVAKMHALAEADAYEAPSPDDEVLDLAQLEADEVHTGADPSSEHSKTADVLSTIAGKPFELVGAALSAVRSRLPD